jgi:hypothetical protein
VSYDVALTHVIGTPPEAVSPAHVIACDAHTTRCPAQVRHMDGFALADERARLAGWERQVHVIFSAGSLTRTYVVVHYCPLHNGSYVPEPEETTG